MQDKCMWNTECEPKVNDCEFFEGNVSKTIEISKNTTACEIKVDMEVEKRRTVRIWGQIKDCKGGTVRCAMVKLIKEVVDCGKKKYIGVAHGVTDCLGFYQFDICVDEKSHGSEKYRIIASKQAVGEEYEMSESECEPCNDGYSCCAK